MKVAVLSGKGGSGKTLLSVNLAAVAGVCEYIDCDVEEPNGHLYFKPNNLCRESVTVKIPEVSASRCDGCQKCAEFCQFNAIAVINKVAQVFEDICHSCGGCMVVCPQKAITEKEHVIGVIEKGFSEDVVVQTGILDIGEASGVPIIDRLLLTKSVARAPVFIDCPPGSGCVVMESIKDADYCVLVAEPTVFGLHNFKMVYQLANLFKIPIGVVLNKCLDGINPSEAFCITENINIIGRIPFDKHLGMLHSSAKIAVRESPQFKTLFETIYHSIKEAV